MQNQSRSSNQSKLPAVFLLTSLFIWLPDSTMFAGPLVFEFDDQPGQPKSSIVVRDCRISTRHEVQLACQRSGVLEKVVKRGSRVTKGEVVAQIHDAIARAAYLVAEKEATNDVEIQFARKAGELAQLKYERARSADRRLSGTVTEFELRELRLAAERSLLQLQQAEQQFAIAQLRKNEQTEQLKSYQVVAPFDAFVRVSPKHPGEYVREGDTVVELVNENVMKVEGLIPYPDLDYIRLGQPVKVYWQKQEDPKPLVFEGQIDFVDSQIEPISMKIRVSAVVTNVNAKLKDGFLATMIIDTRSENSLSMRAR